jgi:NAD(P)-dependent dehydrogenase (short-subunit alcohol dehydrogenase family)
MTRVWLITGISRGLGRTLAEAVLAAGDRVIGTTRSGGTPEGLSGDLSVLPFEASDPAGAYRLAADAFATHSRIDILVNNAGYGLLGAVEDTGEQAVRDIFEVNVFTPFSLIRATLPHFRAQGSGHIINLASIAGVAPSEGAGIYGATKAALAAMSYSLAAELAPFGVWVSVVSPGAFRTEFLGKDSIRWSAGQSAYPEVDSALARWTANDGGQMGDPVLAAAAIIQLVDADEPPLDLLLGQDALNRAERRADRMASDVRAWRSVSANTAHRATAVED